MNHSLSEFRDIVLLLFRVVRNDAYQSHDLNILVNKIHDVLASVEESTPVYLPICEPRSPIEFQDTSTPPTLVIHPDQDVGEIVPNVVVTKEEPDFRNLVVNLPAVVKAVKMEATPTPMTSPVNVVLPGPPSLMATTYKLDSDVAILKDLARDDSEAEVEESEDEGEVMIEDADIADDTDEEPDVEDEEVEDEEDEEDEEEVEAEEEEEAEDEEAEEEEETEEVEEAEDEEEEEAEEDDDLELLKIKKQHYYWSPSSMRIYEFLEEGYGDCLGTYVDGKIIPKA
jgi:hypothetical protein